MLVVEVLLVVLAAVVVAAVVAAVVVAAVVVAAVVVAAVVVAAVVAAIATATGLAVRMSFSTALAAACVDCPLCSSHVVVSTHTWSFTSLLFLCPPTWILLCFLSPQAVRFMPPGIGKWIWFSDMHGFGLQDCNPGTGRAFNHLAGTHYPERLGCMLFVDVPRIFYTLWNLLYPFVDPTTREKLRVLPYDLRLGKKSKLRAALDEWFDEEMSDWLIR